jgi:hypothetical protein
VVPGMLVPSPPPRPDRDRPKCPDSRRSADEKKRLSVREPQRRMDERLLFAVS